MARRETSLTRFLSARFTEAQAAAHERKAAALGISISNLIRDALDGRAPTPRRRKKRPTINEVELGKLMGAVGKIGSHTKQLSHQANAGSWPGDRALAEACADIRWMRNALMRVLGITPPPDPHNEAVPAAEP
jgi:hypothetical protein